MEKLKKQKAKILDDVMETETYKVAKDLLEEFATDAEKRQLNVRIYFYTLLKGFTRSRTLGWQEAHCGLKFCSGHRPKKLHTVCPWYF